MLIDPVYPNEPFGLPLEGKQYAAFSITIGFYDPDANGNPDLNAPQDMSAYVWQCQVRESFSSQAKLVATATVTAGSATNEIVISIPAASMQKAGEFAYDLFGKVPSAPNSERYFMANSFIIHASATKPV